MVFKGFAINNNNNNLGSYIILWNSLEKWSLILSTYAFNNGLRNSLITVFELLEPVTSSTQEIDRFDDLPPILFSIIMDNLQKENKVALLNGDSSSSSGIGPETGVKFL